MVNVGDFIAKEAYHYYLNHNKNWMNKNLNWHNSSIDTRLMWRKITEYTLTNTNLQSNIIAEHIYNIYVKKNNKWINKVWYKLDVKNKKLWNDLVFFIVEKRLWLDKNRL